MIAGPEKERDDEDDGDASFSPGNRRMIRVMVMQMLIQRDR